MTYQGVSAIGWLDTDDRQTRRVREAIAGLDDKEALDPLGLGGIRDAFAERLVPGTSTVQTRIRYFLFVPWLLQELETSATPRRRFAQQLRARELRLIETLRETEGPRAGVIGYRARQRVTRLPSAIYRSGLTAWGIRRDGPGPAWDPGLPPVPPGFPDRDVDLQLTPLEAQYLQDRMMGTRLGLAHEAEQPSLLAVAARDPDRWLGATEPWDGPVDDLPAPVGELLRHGRLFALAIHGAQLRYNTLLCQEGERRCGIDSSELADRIRDWLDDWAAVMSGSLAELTDWWSQPEEFWSAAVRSGARVRPITRGFLHRWITLAVRDPADAITDPSIAAAIVAQELVLKGRYARLTSLAALQSWSGEPLGATPQTYRWPITRRLLNDLSDGLAPGGRDAST